MIQNCSPIAGRGHKAASAPGSFQHLARMWSLRPWPAQRFCPSVGWILTPALWEGWWNRLLNRRCQTSHRAADYRKRLQDVISAPKTKTALIARSRCDLQKGGILRGRRLPASTGPRRTVKHLGAIAQLCGCCHQWVTRSQRRPFGIVRIVLHS